MLNYFLHIQARQKIKRKTHYFYLKFSNFIKKRKINFWFSTTKKQGKKFSIQFPIPCSNILCSNASLLIPREITIDSQRSLFSNCLQASIPLISKVKTRTGKEKHRVLGNEAYHPTTFYTSKSLSARLRNSNRLSLSRDFSFASACYLAATHERGEDRRRCSFKYVVLLDPNDSLWIALSNSGRDASSASGLNKGKTAR